MIKFFVFVALLHCCVVNGQHGSFLGMFHKPLCAAEGTYCYESPDCCSKSCNLESHRCINSGGQGVQVLNENRFGEDGKACQQVGDNCQTGRECCSGECLVSSRRCVNGNGFQPTTMNSSAPQGQKEEQPQIVEVVPDCQQTNQQCSSAKGCCAFLSCERNICQDKAVFVEGSETLGYNPNLPNRFGEGENETIQTEVTTAPANVKCLEIGSKCYKDGECCQPLRCHGFLHKCVT